MPKLRQVVGKEGYLSYKKKKINKGQDYISFDEWRSKVIKSDVGTEAGYSKARRLARKR